MNNDYLVRQSAITADVENICIAGSANWYRRFALFSTNISLMLPQIPFGRHMPLFRKALVNQRLSFLDEDHFGTSPVYWRGGLSPDWDRLVAEPAIFATFHTGSYRLINYLLMRYSLPLAVLLASDVIAKQGDGMLRRAAQFAGPRACELIDAENPASALHILRTLRSGRSLLAYLDGNTGAAAVQDHANLLTLGFLGGRIRVRKGLAYLAHKAQVPLYGILARRATDGIELWLCRHYRPGNGMDASFFAEQATAQLYEDLAQEVQKEPWQWDQWFFLHESMV